MELNNTTREVHACTIIIDEEVVTYRLNAEGSEIVLGNIVLPRIRRSSILPLSLNTQTRSVNLHAIGYSPKELNDVSSAYRRPILHNILQIFCNSLQVEVQGNVLCIILLNLSSSYIETIRRVFSSTVITPLQLLGASRQRRKNNLRNLVVRGAESELLTVHDNVRGVNSQIELTSIAGTFLHLNALSKGLRRSVDSL